MTAGEDRTQFLTMLRDNPSWIATHVDHHIHQWCLSASASIGPISIPDIQGGGDLVVAHLLGYFKNGIADLPEVMN